MHALETAPLSARFTVTDPATGQECEVDILKEIFWRPVAQSPYGGGRRYGWVAGDRCGGSVDTP